MASIHTFRTIARFEMKTLLRSWFFRIFAGFSILALFGFNFSVFFDLGDSKYLFKALPSVIPYVNLLIINLGQAIVAIFLASEFLKQDKKNDTVEVIYARSMSNTIYILGKTTGILFVFLILNLLILALGSVFVYLNNPSALSVWDLLLYPLLISFPTLIFVLGLSFFLMILFKNQAITFIVLLGYVAVTLFFLNEKLYHLFDYIAYNVPMVNSTISGFGDINQVILHRGVYLLFGIGFIFFTIFRLDRLPQAKMFRTLPIYIAIICMVIAVFMAKTFVDVKSEEISIKKQMIALNDKYYDKATVSVLKSNLDLTHQEESIKVIADLEIQNNENDGLKEFIFSLNPELKVIDVKTGNTSLKFTQELQILKIEYPQNLKFKEKCNLQITYEGGISELTHALDQDLNKYSDNFNLEIIRIKKRYAFLNDNYVCLTRESLWYPISGVGYSKKNPAYQRTEFTEYSLKVKTQANLTVVSQGAKTKTSEGEYTFKPEFALPQLSLLIGNYIEATVRVDSIDYTVYTIEGNDEFKSHFTNLNDTLPSLIRSHKDELETKLELEYPFKRLIFAEVPIHYNLTTHTWNIASDAIQPEIVLYPEKGVLYFDADFTVKKKLLDEGGGGRRGRWARMRMGAGNEEYTEEQKEAMMLSGFIKANFYATASQSYDYNTVINYNSFSLFPNYYSFRTNLSSKDWPMLNMSIASYLKNKNESNTVWRWNRWRGISFLQKEDRINLTLKKFSLKQILDVGISEPEIPNDNKISLNEIIRTKGEYLMKILGSKYDPDKYYEFIKQLVKDNSHKSMTYPQFSQLLQENFNDNIDQLLYDWYHKNDLPGYIVENIQTYQVKDGEFTKFQVRFNISNPEPVDGFVTVEISLGRGWGRMGGGEPPFTKDVFIKGGQTLEIGYTFPSKPSQLKVFTKISQNLPHNLEYSLSDFDEVRTSKAMNEVRPLTVYTSNLTSNEIIVDNDDDIGFDTYQLDNKSYLKELIDKNRKEKTYDYGVANWRGAPRRWDPVIKTEYYGKYIHSAHYTKANDQLRKAIWKAKIDRPGSYDVYCHLDKITGWAKRWVPDASYNFLVHSSEGIQERTLYEEEIQKGWNYLGTFYITSDTAIVELTNKSTGVSIYADAIKWVEN